MKTSIVGAVALPFLSSNLFGKSIALDAISVTRITNPEFKTWFGYYDKWQVDHSGRYALGCRVDIDFKSPTEEDTLRIGVIDLKKSNNWIEIGTSKAWGWQQGCMLQWLPGNTHEIIWNDRDDTGFISRVFNFKTRKERTLPRAIYAVSPDAQFALGTEFSRIQNLRPGYGYAGIDDPYNKNAKSIGIYKMNLATGESKLLFSIAQIAAIPHQEKSIIDNWHWFNHLLISPDSKRFLFLHRWRENIEERQVMAVGKFQTRMITADVEGKDFYVLDPSGNSSHFVWRDVDHICAWTKPIDKDWGFWILKDKSQGVSQVGKESMTVNGHNTYVPNTNNEWILNDTYPDKNREQTLYLFHVPTERKVILGKFSAPDLYKGEWRCDLHPRMNQQGTHVFFDSTHEGKGRQMYSLDIREILKSKK